MKETCSLYVRYDDIEERHRKGWLLCKEPLPYPHAAHSVMMEWICNCQVPHHTQDLNQSLSCTDDTPLKQPFL